MTSDRIQEIQRGTAYPESRSVQQALFQVWNEVAQELNKLSIQKSSIQKIIKDEEAKLVIIKETKGSGVSASQVECETLIGLCERILRLN